MKIQNYIATNKNGDIHIFSHKPERFDGVNNPSEVLCFWTTELVNPFKYVTKINEEICKNIIGDIPKWEDESILI